MKNILKNTTLLMLTLLTTCTIQTGQADIQHLPIGKAKNNKIILTTAIAIGIFCTIKAINYFYWTNERIIQWALKGTEKIAINYNFLKNTPLEKEITFSSEKKIVENLIILGKEKFDSLPSNESSSDKKTSLIKDNPILYPLHNALLKIEYDVGQLLKYSSELDSKQLRSNPQAQKISQTISTLLGKLIISYKLATLSSEYENEEKEIKNELKALKDQQIKEKRNAIEKERNAIMMKVQ